MLSCFLAIVISPRRVVAGVAPELAARLEYRALFAAGRLDAALACFSEVRAQHREVVAEAPRELAVCSRLASSRFTG